MAKILKTKPKLNRRMILRWVTPSVAAVTLPRHAYASNTAKPPPLGIDTFCSDFLIFGIQGSIFIEIVTDHADVTLTIFGDTFQAATGTTGINPDGTFSVTVNLGGTPVDIKGTVPPSGSNLPIPFIISIGGIQQASGDAFLGTDCPALTDYDLCGIVSPIYDGQPAIPGNPIPDTSQVIWTFSVSPPLPTGNNIFIEILASCDGGPYVVVGTESLSNAAPATFSSTGETLCPGSTPRTIDVQAQFIGAPDSLTSCPDNELLFVEP